MWRNLRYSIRALRRSPGFTIVAVLTLALGIGANTAIFSVINAVLLRPLPYPDPSRLVRIYETSTAVRGHQDSVAAGNFADWQVQARAFCGMAVLRFDAFTLTGAATPEFLNGERVSPEMLSILGTRPAFGRDFTREDAIPGRDRVVLLGHELWTHRFASDRGIVGRDIVLNFEKYTVIGVLPLDFRTPPQIGSKEATTLLVPVALANAELQSRGAHNYQVFARLRPGVSPERAQFEMDAIAGKLAKTYASNQGRGARVVTLIEEVVGNFRSSLLIVFGAAGLILLISCANLANVLLARGTGQQREIAVRLAIGANRFRVIGELLVQNLVLAALGCAGGVLAAVWGLKALHALAPGNLPRMNEVSLDGATLAFAIVVSLITGLAFGILPAFHLSGTHTGNTGFSLSTRGAGGSEPSVLRWRNVLVAAQVALSIVLLVGAGLLLKSFARLRGIDLGFQPNRTLAMKIMLPRTKYSDQQKRLQFFATLAERVRSLPGVAAAGYSNQLPMRGGWGGSFSTERSEIPTGPNDDTDFQIVSPQYFDALGIKILRGRVFNDSDRAGSQPVAIVNKSLARHYWPNSDPIGARIRKGGPNSPFAWLTIVGIADDVRLRGPADQANVELYFPSGQAQDLPISPSDFAVRAAVDPLALAAAVQREVWSLDREQPVTSVRTMDEVLVESTSHNRFNTLLIGLFAGLALLLSAVGIYGVVSYSVAQRASEIGIRMAVGARPADILRLIFRQIATTMTIGAAIGIAAALALTRYVTSILFDIQPHDPATFASAIGVLVVAGLAAALIPARRAMRVDPIEVLRSE
jgi:predicted permease